MIAKDPAFASKSIVAFQAGIMCKSMTKPQCQSQGWMKKEAWLTELRATRLCQTQMMRPL